MGQENSTPSSGSAPTDTATASGSGTFQVDGEDIRSKYVVEKKLGEGGFGVVFLVKDRETGECFAVKSITKGKMTSSSQRRLLEEEVKFMQALKGKTGIVTLHETFDNPKAMQLVMELCSGGELFDQIIARASYSEADAAAAIRQMLQIVDTCHTSGIVHRDLKPENFLYKDDKYEELKITDFGLSAQKPPEGTFLKDCVGSAYYMAPEILREKYDHKVDVWAAGCILYILLSGIPPFNGRTDREIARRIKSGVFDLESAPWPTISEGAKNAIRRMLELDREKRPEAAEMLEDPWIKEDGVAPTVPLETMTFLKENMREFYEMNRLRQAALLDMARLVDDGKFADLKEQFELADTDKSGNISLDELKAVVKRMKMDIAESQVELLFKSYDVNSDGAIGCVTSSI